MTDYQFTKYNDSVSIYSETEDMDVGYILHYDGNDPLFKIEVTLRQSRLEQLIAEFEIWKTTL